MCVCGGYRQCFLLGAYGEDVRGKKKLQQIEHPVHPAPPPHLGCSRSPARRLVPPHQTSPPLKYKQRDTKTWSFSYCHVTHPPAAHLPYHPNGLVQCVRHVRPVHRNGLAMNLICPARVVAEVVDGERHVSSPAVGDGLQQVADGRPGVRSAAAGAASAVFPPRQSKHNETSRQRFAPAQPQAFVPLHFKA